MKSKQINSRSLQFDTIFASNGSEAVFTLQQLCTFFDLLTAKQDSRNEALRLFPCAKIFATGDACYGHVVGRKFCTKYEH